MKNDSFFVAKNIIRFQCYKNFYGRKLPTGEGVSEVTENDGTKSEMGEKWSANSSRSVKMWSKVINQKRKNEEKRPW